MGKTKSEDQCILLGGVFSAFIQACLAVICVGTLIIKRQNEVPKRDWFVWFLDVMKQGVGSSFGHFSNIFLSVIIAQSLTGGDECQWYCLTYVIDSTFGTFLNLMFLSCFEKVINHYQYATEYLNFGEYGDPPNLNIFALQLCIWLTIVILGKTIILFVLLQAIVPIDDAMSVVFRVFKGHPDVELVLVMIVIPGILNTLQFWVTDTFLKKQVTEGELLSLSEHGAPGLLHLSPRSASKHRHSSHGGLANLDPDLDEELISSDSSVRLFPSAVCSHLSHHVYLAQQVSPMSRSPSQDAFLRTPGNAHFKQYRVNRRGSDQHPRSRSGQSLPAREQVFSGYLPDSSSLSSSTKLYVLPPASFLSRMYKQSGIPTAWGHVFGRGPSPRAGSDSKRSPLDGEDDEEDDDLFAGHPSSSKSSSGAYHPIGEGGGRAKSPLFKGKRGGSSATDQAEDAYL